MKDNTKTQPFNLDFGTVPTTSSLEVINVTIDSTQMFGDFAIAYDNELRRRNPIRYEAVGITSQDIEYYINGILAIHIQNDRHQSKVWREAKQLLIPTWIQFVISMIGTVVDTNSGLKFVPVFDFEYDMNKMLEVSQKLTYFIPDGVGLHKDAFPRDTEGDLDVMSFAVMNNYVCSMRKESHPLGSYVAAFLGFKLQQEATFKILYRVRYDDVEFIRSMLFADDTITK